jgi:hypothetical protein
VNAWQVAKQLRHLLRLATWSDSPTDKVFGQVIVGEGVSEKAVSQIRFPFALIVPLDATADDEEPTLERQRYEIQIVTRVANDPLGESTLIGAQRPSLGKSGGRGIMELEEVLLNTVVTLNRVNGVRIRSDYKTAAESRFVDGMGYVGTRGYRFEALLTSSRSYESPTRLTAVYAGPNVNLAWNLPPARYDDLGLVLRRASGTTAPATPSAGTGVTVGAGVSSVTDTGASGTVSYSLWRTFNEVGGAAAERYSDSPATATAT